MLVPEEAPSPAGAGSAFQCPVEIHGGPWQNQPCLSSLFPAPREAGEGEFVLHPSQTCCPAPPMWEPEPPGTGPALGRQRPWSWRQLSRSIIGRSLQFPVLSQMMNYVSSPHQPLNQLLERKINLMPGSRRSNG